MKTMEVNSKEKFFAVNSNFKKVPYEDILKEFFKIFCKHLFNGKAIQTSIGTFEVIRFKPTRLFKKRPIDYKATKQEGFIIRHMNEHTNGYACKINFTPIARYRNYKYKAARTLARLFAAYILQNKDSYKQYYEVSKHQYRNIQAGTISSGASTNS
jgi:hypothetical protein